ncbi:MAG: alpha-ketoglutarate-dependent dioxygenase AlkB [Chryseobacterium sp.]|nr:MAG: alpha-ketoglutarate-dependent dioxygenase AlkB [Chryseobacterium sp.]
MELSLFDPQEFDTFNLLPKDGEVYYYPQFLSNDEADLLLAQIQNYQEYTQDSINFKGKIQLIPRLQAWYGDPDKPFSYSGIKLNPSPWKPELISLNDKLREKTGKDFSSVLVNLYRDGNDSVSWHCDDSPELGVNPYIASISLGAVRTFKLRNLEDKTLKKDIRLEHGSLLIMAGETQHKWQHSVPKEEINGPRVNLTYRIIV